MMGRRASLFLLLVLSALGWLCIGLALAITWVGGRFVASLLGWA
ncbi:hypothetical protein [Rubritepida flocculans]|nr:hypothetical protein [Rubritepida flocculans]